MEIWHSIWMECFLSRGVSINSALFLMNRHSLLSVSSHRLVRHDKGKGIYSVRWLIAHCLELYNFPALLLLSSNLFVQFLGESHLQVSKCIVL